jgi:hypothetical protein
MDSLGLPLVLLGAVWGAFSPVLKAIEMLNERRDKVLGHDPKLSLKHRKLLLYSDWLPIMLGAYTFLFIISAFILRAPEFANVKPDIKVRATEIFSWVSWIFFAWAVAGLVGNVFDFWAMWAHLNKLSLPNVETKQPPENRNDGPPGAQGTIVTPDPGNRPTG